MRFVPRPVRFLSVLVLLLALWAPSRALAGGGSGDTSITKTDGVTTATAGGTVTYTIVVSNAGPSTVGNPVVSDTFPPVLTCSVWTCVATPGSVCTPAGSGNINDSATSVLSGGTLTYTAVCTVSASATGSISNTATVTNPISVADPNTGNNSATDTDTIPAPAPPPVPTLSPFGIALLAALLIGLAVRREMKGQVTQKNE